MKVLAGWLLLVVLCALFGNLVFAQEPKRVTIVPTKPVPYSFMILPPPEYDHEYEGDLAIKMVDTLGELYVLCMTRNPYMLACSLQNSRSCLVIMVNDEIMRKRGWTTGLLLRHEIGHCNGWSGDHPGQRYLLTSTHWVPEKDRVKLPLDRLERADKIRAGAPQ